MPTQRVLIGWPLTPFTGWGSYGIQLAQSLISKKVAQPIVPHPIQVTSMCDVHWKIWAEQIEMESEPLIRLVDKRRNELITTNCQLVFEGIGNSLERKEFEAKYKVGVTFFERSTMPKEMIDSMKSYDLIICGSKWNHKILTENGLENTVLVHQGVDLSRFNPIQQPRLLHRSLVIFAGGKLEIRKGQDVVIEAFKRFIKLYPDALMIACWANVGDIGINTMDKSSYIKNNPKSGKAIDIHSWIVEQGIPEGNILVPTATNNNHLPGLIKQADTAIFASRCEGGTNLMAMEALACGIPTLVSENSGHVDLIEENMEHIIALKKHKCSECIKDVTRNYGGDDEDVWGETDPEEIVMSWVDQVERKDIWREKGIIGAKKMYKWSWDESMRKLHTYLNKSDLLFKL